MILVHKTLNFFATDTLMDEAGRYVMVRGCMHGAQVTLLTVYGPKIDTPECFTNLFTKCHDYLDDLVICCRDINTVLCSGLDRSSKVVRPLSVTASN